MLVCTATVLTIRSFIMFFFISIVTTSSSVLLLPLQDLLSAVNSLFY